MRRRLAAPDTMTVPSGPLPPAGTPAPPARGEAAPAWRVGQVLAATVVSAPQHGISDLRIGTLLVRAQTGELPLSPGQTLRLEVASLKEQPVLRLLDLVASNPLTAAMRNTLPRQQPLAPLLASLARAAGDPAASRQLAPEVVHVARELFSRLPAAASLGQAAGLREALRNSGLFLESKLARTAAGAAPAAPSTPSRPPGAGADFKANLIRLVQVLRENSANSTPSAPRSGATGPGPATATGLPAAAPAPPSPVTLGVIPAHARAAAAAGVQGDPAVPPLRGQPPQPQAMATSLARLSAALDPVELLRQSEGALARIQLNQLSSLAHEGQAAAGWPIELPVRRDGHVDLWSLSIRRDPDRGGTGAAEENTPGWSVTLAFELPGLGPMQARVALRGTRITAQFFSPVQTIPPLVRAHLPLLDARLRAAGLEVGELGCSDGRLPAAVSTTPSRILDERA